MKKQLFFSFLMLILIFIYSCKKEGISSSSLTEFYSSVSAGAHHSLAISTDNSLWAWGYNGEHGSLGDASDIVARSTPVQIGSGYSMISSGGYFSLAIKADGTLWAWGNNEYGQLGDGTNIDKNTPVQIGSGYIAIATGHDHSLALKADKTLWS
jgi:alpha-tubulin suppressor-like RCC1 family protein